MRITKFCVRISTTVFALLTAFVSPAASMDQAVQADQLAKQLANPVAALISVPLQFNYDENIGPMDKGKRFTLNLQPVVPFEINDKWNLISRTILPIIDQKDIAPGSGSQSGLGDTVESLFFSPRPGPSGAIWGVGPVFLLPTATDDLLGTEKWGAGLSAVLLKQTGLRTYGGLINHIESFAGEDSRSDVSMTYINPFISTRFEGGWTLGTQLEHTLDYENDLDSGVISVFLSKVFSIGGQNFSVGVIPKYWYQDSSVSPEGFAFRVNVTFIFPR